MSIIICVGQVTRSGGHSLKAAQRPGSDAEVENLKISDMAKRMLVRKLSNLKKTYFPRWKTSSKYAIYWVFLSFQTYSANRMVPDSSSTATALFCGVKTNDAILGLDATVPLRDCAASLRPEARLNSLAADALNAGKSAGNVLSAHFYLLFGTIIINCSPCS